MRLTFVSAVPAMIGAIAWGAWDGYAATQRAVAARPRTPPAHVRALADAGDHELTPVTRSVADQEWRRWDAKPRGR